MNLRKDKKALQLRSPIAILIGAYVVGLLLFTAYGSWNLLEQGHQLMRKHGLVAPTAAELAREKAHAEAVIAELKSITDYQRAAWHPIHFRPSIETATSEQCLACHQEVLTKDVRQTSPAGLDSAKSLAWYQTLDTYGGEQESFHARHLKSSFAKEVMNLQCNFCHQGHDLRDEAPSSSATSQTTGFSLRKVVDPSTTCLLCHGSFPAEVMGFEKDQKWHALRGDIESAETPNGCLTCHSEQFRTVRHRVTYLNATAIEARAKRGSSDGCYGCHGGRAWYRTSFAYPRHPWPGMDPTVPDWAKDRPTQSDARYRLKK